MEKITQKTNEPYIWDINGEDYYWIINENVLEHQVDESDVVKNVSCNTTLNKN